MRVLVAEPIAEAGLEMLRREVEVDFITGLSKEQLLERIPEYDALITRSETKATAEVLARGTRLKVVGRAGVGVDNIDVDAATERGIVVVNVPNANTIATAEHALGMMLALARNIPQAHISLKGGQWQRTKFVGVELRGKTLGIIGLGRIGSELCIRARAFGMKVLAHDPYVSVKRAEQIGAELCDLRHLLSESDFVSIHAAKTSETNGMIREREIMLMKKGARLINCARGGMVDEEALYRALTSGHLAGAALDVFAEEPARQNPLFELPNVVVTPHISASTVEAQEMNGTVVAEQVLRVLRGEVVPEAVNLPSLPPEQVRASKPYLPLAEALGRFLAQAFPVRPERVRVELAGQVAEAASVLLTNTVLKGLLQGMLEEEVNFINAPVIAAQRGITVTESRSSTPRGFLSLVSLAVEGADGAATISGTLAMDGSVRFVEVGGFPVDFVPARYQIVTRHQDKPGMIGQVGTILGARGINIAGMQVGRRSIGGEAVMILQVDDPVDDATLSRIAAVAGIMQVRQVFLP